MRPDKRHRWAYAQDVERLRRLKDSLPPIEARILGSSWDRLPIGSPKAPWGFDGKSNRSRKGRVIPV